jgi:hypothetical protein
MKKHLMILVLAVMAVAMAAPAFAEVQFTYGGQFRVRFEAQDNVYDGTSKGGYFGSVYNSDDNRRFIDQRTRLYFTFAASKNLKVVVKWEMGDAVWGMNSTSGASIGNTGANAGANVGADAVSIEVKNAYVQFNIPNTPTTAIIGVQEITMLDSWMLDDDFPAALLITKLDPFKVTLGYIGAQHGWERKFAPNTELPLTDSKYDVDTVFGALDYAQGPFKASLNLLFQDAHNTDISINPTTLSTPYRNATGFSSLTGTAADFPFTNGLAPRNNYLFDLGFNLTYKVDWLLAYVNFVKNFGSVDLYSSINPNAVQLTSADYTGYMIDAGVTYFCGPWTVNLGGFYTSGPDISSTPEDNFGGKFYGIKSNDINWFTYPMSTGKYFSEIIGGGVLGDDLDTPRGYNHNENAGNIGSYGETVRWRGVSFPSNLWTVTLGGSYQLAKDTKLSGSYWYFGTAASVPVAFDARGNYKMSSSIGHELDFYLDQTIVEGLTLTLVAAYLVADDAFCPMPNPTSLTDLAAMRANKVYYSTQADNAFELGAKLQWNF